MSYNDLRDFLSYLDGAHDLKLVEGADRNLEIGGITELMAESKGPALLFDKIKDYPPGLRVAANLFVTPSRAASALGLPCDIEVIEMINEWRNRLRKYSPIPPIEVKTGPVKENIFFDSEVDLQKFPVPKWHQQDGGYYIGTGCVVIMRDPDTGLINLGTYRIQVHDKSTTGIYMSPGRHGRIIMQKYHNRGEPCPVAVSCGQEPGLFLSAGIFYEYAGMGQSEYGFAGWLKGKPVNVVKGSVTDLPIPASSEIVLEGEIPLPSDKQVVEGPFGEYTGYYAAGARPEPVIRVKALLHRDDPIIQGNPSLKVPMAYNIIPISGLMLDAMEKVGFPDVKGLWIPTPHNGVIIVAVKQRYPGHAKQIGTFLASTVYLGRYVIMVDEDVDITDTSEVLWAVSTRSDPSASITVIPGLRGTPLDPRLPPDKRAKGDFTLSMAVIDACRPFDWKEQFPTVNAFDLGYKNAIKEKWQSLFSG